MSRQMRANSTMGPVLEGSLSAVGRRPEPGHQLVGDTSAQKGAHPAEPVVEVTVELVIHHVPIDLAVRALDEAIERHRHRQDDLSHGLCSGCANALIMAPGTEAGSARKRFLHP